MKRISIILILLIGFYSTSCGQTAPIDTTIIGTWQGALNISSFELRIVLHFSDNSGVLEATLDSPDQSVRGIQVKDISWQNSKLSLQVPRIGASFTGSYNSGTKLIEGTFTQLGKSMPLTLEKNGDVKINMHPQEPKPPFPYRTEEVKYNGGEKGVTLSGTLSIPNGKGPFATVLLITGSGPQDRDEALLGHKPFAVIADYFTRNGVAVLRVDDRGYGKSTGDFSSATSADFANDALAGVAFLKRRKEVNKKKIGLIGHSEGGLIAPMVAVRSKDVGFIIMMAGPGVNGRDLLREQNTKLMQSQKIPDTLITKCVDMIDKCYGLAQGEGSSSSLSVTINTIMKDWVKGLSADDRKALGMEDESEIGQQSAQILSPWFRYFLKYDPRPTLLKVRCPVLAINGAKDLQVLSGQNLPVIEAALKEGGNTDYSVTEYPNLNHLFQTCQTGAVSEYSKIEETIAPVVLDAMLEWVLKH